MPITEPASTLVAPQVRPPRSKKLYLLVFVVVIFVLSAGAIALWFYNRQTLPVVSEEPVVVTPPKSVFESFLGTKNYIAFAMSDNVPTFRRVRVYDLDTKKFLELPQELAGENVLFTLGAWSPDLKYIPILKSNVGSSHGETLYLFDPKLNTIKTLVYLDEEATQDNFKLNYSSIMFGSKWLSNGEFLYYHTTGADRPLVTSQVVSVDGVDKTIELPRDQIVGTKLPGIDTLDGRNVVLLGKNYTISTAGKILGAVHGQLVMVDVLGSPYDFSTVLTETPDPAMQELEKMMNEKMQQGASEEELSNFMLDAMTPKGDVKMFLLDPATAKRTDLVVLNSSEFPHISDAQLDASGKVVFRRDASIFASSKYEFAEASLTNGLVKVLISKTINTKGDNTPTSVLEDDAYFFLSEDGRWIVYYHEGDILALDRSTLKESDIICDGSSLPVEGLNCMGLKISNPRYSY